jgi:hypothetical protein
MLTHPSVNIFVGKSKSGKTHLLKYFLYELSLKQKIDLVLLFSRTSEQPQYNFIPEQWRHPDFSLDIFKKVVKMQRKSQRKHGAKPNIVLIIDDGNSASKSKTEDFINLLNSYRHYNLTLILGIQYLSGNVSTNFREQVDNCYIFKTKSGPSLEGNYKAFFESLGIGYKEYVQMNKQLPKFHCFHINQDSDDVEICIAPPELPNYEFIYRSGTNVE